MSIALLNQVTEHEERIKRLESSMICAVSLADVTELILQNKRLAEKLEALERKANKRG